MKVVAVARSDRRPVNTSLHISGLALLLVAPGMLISAGVEVVDGGSEVWALVAGAAICGAVGALLWRGTRVPVNVTAASAFAGVAWSWIIVSVFGALPYVFVGLFEHVDEALFESIAGFTGTGSTVLSPIEGNGAGILFWRQFTQWYGGIGMVVLAVAVLPFLGVGGLELLRAEAPGPDSDRLTPRVSETAKRLFVVYAALTVLTAAGLLLAGTSMYDAVGHSFSAVSTGGFSPYDTSVAHFASVAVEMVLIVSMVLGAVNFTLHWKAAQGSPGVYWRFSEFRWFLGFLSGGIAIVTFLNVVDGATALTALRESVFTVVSIGTTTGFGTADWGLWGPAAQFLLLGIMFSGAMTGSTSGGPKVFRLQTLVKFTARELRRARHPRGVFMIRHDGVGIQERIVGVIAGFLVLYIGIFVIGTLCLTALGADIVTAIGGAATAMGCVGPGLGDAGPTSNFLVFSRPARLVIDVLMLMGRLEIFPVLLMFAAPWRAMAARGVQKRSRPFAPASANVEDAGNG